MSRSVVSSINMNILNKLNLSHLSDINYGHFLYSYLLCYYLSHLEKCIDYGEDKRIIIHLGLNEIDSSLLHSFYGYGSLDFDSDYNYLGGFIYIREYYVTDANINTYLSLPRSEINFILNKAKLYECDSERYNSVNMVGDVSNCNLIDWLENHEYFYYDLNPSFFDMESIEDYDIFDLEYSLSDYGFYDVSLHSDNFYINYYKNYFYSCFSLMYYPLDSRKSFMKSVA